MDISGYSTSHRYSRLYDRPNAELPYTCDWAAAPFGATAQESS